MQHAYSRKGSSKRKNKFIPEVVIDFCFPSQGDEPCATVIVMRCCATGATDALMIPSKGYDSWVVRTLVSAIERYGHAKIILKSDGEPAMRAIRKALAKHHGGVEIPEEPPTGESQSNGLVEEPGKTIREMVKVYKDQIEANIKKQIDPQDKIMQWMVRWAAMAYNRYKRCSDGKTAYERQKERKCRIESIPFGQKVMYKKVRSGETHKKHI